MGRVRIPGLHYSLVETDDGVKWLPNEAWSLAHRVRDSGRRKGVRKEKEAVPSVVAERAIQSELQIRY